MLRPHPESSRLRSRLTGCSTDARPWDGTVYRIVTYRFATRGDLLTGAGSKRFGGRWNPPGCFEAVYAGLDIETAIAEVYGRFTRAGLTPVDLTPRVLVAIEVRLAAVLDLTSGGARRRLRVSSRRMTTEPWEELQAIGQEALTQAVGRAAWEVGLEGLLTPSAASPNGANLVVFPGRLGSASEMKIIEADELPDRSPVKLP